MKIGIISDTHGVFDEQFQKFFENVDQIWHAGDIGSLQLADNIAAFKPLIAVHGNIDDNKVRTVYKKFAHFQCQQISVLITHIGYDIEAKRMFDKLNPTIFITGHSHILKVHNIHNTLCINPGAAGHGYQNVRTAIRLEIDGERIHSMEILEI